MKTRILILLCVATAAVLLTPLTAWCVDNYPIPEREEGVAWLALAYGAATLVGICVVGFKNSKRTHLD